MWWRSIINTYLLLCIVFWLFRNIDMSRRDETEMGHAAERENKSLTWHVPRWWTPKGHFSSELIPKPRISILSEFMCCCRKHLLVINEDLLKYYKKPKRINSGNGTWRDIISTIFNALQCWESLDPSCQQLFDNSEFRTGRQSGCWTAVWRTEELGFGCFVCFIYYLYALLLPISFVIILCTVGGQSHAEQLVKDDADVLREFY